MGNDRELMGVQVETLFTLDGRSRLLAVNEAGSKRAAPRMFLGRTREGNLWRFRADLPEGLVEELAGLCAREVVGGEFERPPRHRDDYVRLLEQHGAAERIWEGPAYRVGEPAASSRAVVAITDKDAEKLRGGFEKLEDELDGRLFLAIVEEGRVVSVCRSVRIGRAAQEAGVETLPAFRGQGYARDVVAGWAAAVRAMGAIPLYSTSWENTASQAVAKKLGAAMYGVDFHIT